MNTAKSLQEAAIAHTTLVTEIEQLLGRIRAACQPMERPNWANVGDLGMVAGGLRDLVEALDSIPRES